MELRYRDTPFVKFVLSGILSAIAQFATLILLVEGFAVDATVSSGIAFSLSVLVNYLLLYYWAFRSIGKHHVVFAKFLIIGLVTLLLNIGFFWVLTVVLGIWYILSQTLTIGFISVFSYFSKKNYIF